MVLELIVSGLGLIVLSVAFVRLGASDATERLYLLAFEYGFSVLFLLAGVALVGLALTRALG
jgi:hypothetical protein